VPPTVRDMIKLVEADGWRQGEPIPVPVPDRRFDGGRAGRIASARRDGPVVSARVFVGCGRGLAMRAGGPAARSAARTGPARRASRRRSRRP